MTKKRGLSRSRGLDILMGDIKKERYIAGIITDQDNVAYQPINATPAIAHRASDDLVNTSPTQFTNNHSNTHGNNTHGNNTPNTSNTNANNQQNDTADTVALVQMPINQLQSGKYQPRQEMDSTALSELANSIGKHGVMQPIVIRPLALSEQTNGITHEIIAGERRWRAAKMAGLVSIPAICRQLSDEVAIALALIENIQREDLNALEQAEALQRFHSEFGMSHAMIADVVGKARATVTNLLRLNALHDNVKEHLMSGQIDMGHARCLLSLPNDMQPVIAKKIINGNLTVRASEKLVKSILTPHLTASKARQSPNADHDKLNRELSDMLGADVKVHQHANGQSRMEIVFYSDNEMYAIIQKLQALSGE